MAEEVFINLAEQVAGLVGVATKANNGNQVDQLAELAVRQLGAGVALVEDVFQGWVFRLDRSQGLVDAFADVHLFGGGAQRLPAGHFRYPEHIHFFVVVALFQLAGQEFGILTAQVVVVAGIGKTTFQLGATAGEAVGDVLEEDQTENYVLVFGGIHIGAHLVSGGPQSFLQVLQGAAGLAGFGGIAAGFLLRRQFWLILGIIHIVDVLFWSKARESLTQCLFCQAGWRLFCAIGTTHRTATTTPLGQQAFIDQSIAHGPEHIFGQLWELPA